MKHFALHAIHAIIHLAWTLAVSCFGGDFWGAGWTGLRVCVGDPIRAIRGDSDCGPCNRLVSDVRDYTRGLNWKVGCAEFVDGVPQHIAIVRAIEDRPTPYVEVVVDGSVTRTVSGYRGDVEREIISLYPLSMTRRTKKVSVALPPTPSVKLTRTVAGPTWTWPGDLRTHLAAEHGYSMAWLSTLTTAELIALHDDSHNSRTVVRSAQAPTIRSFRTVQPSVQTQGFSMLGVPVYQQYRSSCPGGICPP